MKWERVSPRRLLLSLLAVPPGSLLTYLLIYLLASAVQAGSGGWLAQLAGRSRAHGNNQARI